MKTKTFEVTDQGRCIPVLAVKLEPGCKKDWYLFRRSGLGGLIEIQKNWILLTRLTNLDTQYDPYCWDNVHRTMKAAHMYITANFDELESGEVVDVEFIEGEVSQPKISERESLTWSK